MRLYGDCPVIARIAGTAASLVDGRSERAAAHDGSNELTAQAHAELLRAAGFTEAAPLWQFGDDHVLAAIR